MIVDYRFDAAHMRVGRAGTGGWLAIGLPQAPSLMLGATAVIGSFTPTVPVQMYFLGGRAPPSSCAAGGEASPHVDDVAGREQCGARHVL